MRPPHAGPNFQGSIAVSPELFFHRWKLVLAKFQYLSGAARLTADEAKHWKFISITLHHGARGL
jgi:hypothetical protein